MSAHHTTFARRFFFSVLLTLWAVIGFAFFAIGPDSLCQAVELTVRGYDADANGRIVDRSWRNDPTSSPPESVRVTLELPRVSFPAWFNHLEVGTDVSLRIESKFEPCGDSRCELCRGGAK